MLFIQNFQSILSSSQCLHCLCQISLTFCFYLVSCINCLFNHFFFALNALFQDISLCLIDFDLFHFFFCVNCSLFQFRLQINQVDFHSFNRFLCDDNLFITILIFEDIRLNLFSLLVKQFLKCGNKFNVRCWSDIIISFKFMEELFCPFGCWRMIILHHLNAFFSNRLLHFNWA